MVYKSSIQNIHVIMIAYPYISRCHTGQIERQLLLDRVINLLFPLLDWAGLGS